MRYSWFLMVDHQKSGPPRPTSKAWAALHLWQIQFVRDAIFISLLVGLVMLGYKLSTVTVPMLLAIALAYLFEPVVARVTRSGLLTRPAAAVMIIVLAGVLVVVPVSLGIGFGVLQGAKYAQLLARNIDTTIRSINAPEDEELRMMLPERGWRQIRNYIIEEKSKHDEVLRQESQENPPPTELQEQAGPEQDNAGAAAGETATPEVVTGPDGAKFGVQPAQVPTTGASGVATSSEPKLIAVRPSVEEPSDLYQLVMMVGEWIKTNAAGIGKRALSAGSGAVDAAFTTLGSIFKVGFGGFLTAFFFYFFCTGFGRLLAFWNGLIPERRRGRVVDLLSQMDEVVAGFVRGRLTICAMLIVYYSLAYWMVGVPAPLVVGLCVGLLTLVPYAAGTAVPVVMILLWLNPVTGTFKDAWWWIVGAPIVVLAIQQFLDDYLLTPRIQGKTTNMDTPTILFASIAGGVLAGFYGLLLAIPVAACIKILLREVVWPRVRAWIQGRAEDPLPMGQAPKT